MRTAGVAVPKAAMDRNREPIAAKDDVGTAGQIPRV
jgi:hypothetical protein